MKIGTNCFITRKSAVLYYRNYGDNSKAVDQKIKEKEIIIGKPALKAGEKLITDMNEGRYFIEY